MIGPDDWNGEAMMNGEALMNGTAWSDTEGERVHVDHQTAIDCIEPRTASESADRVTFTAWLVRDLERGTLTKFAALRVVLGRDGRSLEEIGESIGASRTSVCNQVQRYAKLLGVPTIREGSKSAYSAAWHRKRRTAQTAKNAPLEMDIKNPSLKEPLV